MSSCGLELWSCSPRSLSSLRADLCSPSHEMFGQRGVGVHVVAPKTGAWGVWLPGVARCGQAIHPAAERPQDETQAPRGEQEEWRDMEGRAGGFAWLLGVFVRLKGFLPSAVPLQRTLFACALFCTASFSTEKRHACVTGNYIC